MSRAVIFYSYFSRLQLCLVKGKFSKTLVMDSFQGTKSDETSKPKKSKKKKKSAEALVVPEQEVLPEPEVEPQNDIVIEDSEDNAMDLVVEEQVNNTIFYI